ncbi:hypothetical protein ACFQ3K_03200 [Brucella gallinifaecis]|uniref:Uncharacterized protein n=1 Tax=Brucella gallinifaecis TaxID=215590 RepID=A0A502BN22_9HYPH|nr:hypothetical protein [Brucella gallinifaecis]TPF75227.1 hypothetical protein FHY56_10980 [Brucella gallinifaecis]
MLKPFWKQPAPFDKKVGKASVADLKFTQSILTTLCFVTIITGIGAIIHITGNDMIDAPTYRINPDRNLASVTTTSMLMQPLPEMPSESPPGISIELGVFIPWDLSKSQGIDPIITGPRS